MTSLINFTPLRTKRLTIQLSELTLGQSIELASMNPISSEAVATAFLRAASEAVSGEKDPLNWTVQERMFAIAHYLSSVLEDGPNFALGGAHYADYLDGATDNSDVSSVFIGEVEGDKWHLRHLTGLMAESIERLQGLVERSPGSVIEGRSHWLIGMMAAQLYVDGDDYAPSMEDGETVIDEWLLRRMQILINFPSSGFESVLYAYHLNKPQLSHLFDVGCDDKGLITLPSKKEGALPPCRFPVHACLPGYVLKMV